MRLILFLSLPLYALDQWSKQLVLRLINPYEARIVVPDFFSLVNVTNTGAAFGSFKGNNTFFIVISIVALVVVTVFLVRRRGTDAWRNLSLALLLAGILGNLTDRLLYGHVIDFLLFNLHVRYADPWPAFNVADSCISIAVVLFIIQSFGKEKYWEIIADNLSRNAQKFFTELKRRKIFIVAIAYVVIAWLLMQIASQTLPSFEIPNWVMRFVVLLLVIGLPVAVMLAWRFELTTKGIKRRENVNLSKVFIAPKLRWQPDHK